MPQLASNPVFSSPARAPPFLMPHVPCLSRVSATSWLLLDSLSTGPLAVPLLSLPCWFSRHSPACFLSSKSCWHHLSILVAPILRLCGLTPFRSCYFSGVLGREGSRGTVVDGRRKYMCKCKWFFSINIFKNHEQSCLKNFQTIDTCNRKHQSPIISPWEITAGNILVYWKLFHAFNKYNLIIYVCAQSVCIYT